jgi:hypothetical protein
MRHLWGAIPGLHRARLLLLSDATDNFPRRGTSLAVSPERDRPLTIDT